MWDACRVAGCWLRTTTKCYADTDTTANQVGASHVIHFYELDDDSGKCEKFGKMTDDGEIIDGEELLLSIYRQERW